MKKVAANRVPARPVDANAKERQERQERRLLRPAGCRSYMRSQLAEKFPGIVDGFVKAAKTGSVPHVKLATELLKPTRKGTTRKKGIVTKLLEKLEREEAARSRSEASSKAGETEQPPH